MSQWIRVAESEECSENEIVEIELDFDGTLRLTELCSQFPGATGLRYRNPGNGRLRAVKSICLPVINHTPQPPTPALTQPPAQLHNNAQTKAQTQSKSQNPNSNLNHQRTTPDTISTESLTSIKTISSNTTPTLDINNNEDNSSINSNSTINNVNQIPYSSFTSSNIPDKSSNHKFSVSNNTYKINNNNSSNTNTQSHTQTQQQQINENTVTSSPQNQEPNNNITSNTTNNNPNKTNSNELSDNNTLQLHNTVLKAPDGGQSWPDYLYLIVNKNVNTTEINHSSSVVLDNVKQNYSNNLEENTLSPSNKESNNKKGPLVLSENKRLTTKEQKNINENETINKTLDPSMSRRLTAVKEKDLSSTKQCSDLIVLGLPWKATEETLSEYFAKFGDLVMVQVKRDAKTNKSRGYGFIRYQNYESQKKVLTQKHYIENRNCDVKLPHSKVGDETNRKIFVGRITQDLTKDIIKAYFNTYGEVFDVFIPSPFRAFAFVTFENAETAADLLNEDHLINGVSVYTSSAEPKNNSQQVQQNSNSNNLSSTQQVNLLQQSNLSGNLNGNLTDSSSQINGVVHNNGVNNSTFGNNTNVSSINSSSSRYRGDNNSQLHSNTNSSLNSANINNALAQVTGQANISNNSASLSTPPYNRNSYTNINNNTFSNTGNFSTNGYTSGTNSGFGSSHNFSNNGDLSNGINNFLNFNNGSNPLGSTTSLNNDGNGNLYNGYVANGNNPPNLANYNNILASTTSPIPGFSSGAQSPNNSVHSSGNNLYNHDFSVQGHHRRDEMHWRKTQNARINTQNLMNTYSRPF